MRRDINIKRFLKDKIDSELETGEIIQLIEMPVPIFFTPAARGAFLFGIPWTAFALFWSCGAAGFSLPDLSEGLKGFQLFPLVGIPFILIGFGMLSSPLWAYRKAFNTVYVLTDRRAITFDGGKSITIRSYPPEKLQDIYRKEKKNGTGDVIINVRAWKDFDGDKHSEELGFLRVKNPKEIEQKLKKLAERIRIDCATNKDNE